MTANLPQQSNPWTVIQREVKFDCPYFSVRQDLVRFQGLDPRPYSSIRVKKCGVCVAPIDALGNVTLVGQYRYVLDGFTWELPGGGADAEGDLLEAARSELAEETGLSGGQWLEMFRIPVAGATFDQVSTGFIAWNLEQGTPRPEPEEQLVLRRASFHEAVSMALNNEIKLLAASTLLLAIHSRLHRGELPPDLTDLLLQKK